MTSAVASAVGGALDDVRVVDLGGALTAYCSKLLTELGADVACVEPPGGDELRHRGPWLDAVPGLEQSLLYAHYHAGQRSVTLDVAASAARDVLAALAAWADVVLISPSTKRPLVGYDAPTCALEWSSDHTIVCAITGYGLTGPHALRRVTPLASEAAGGGIFRLGPPGGAPMPLPGRQAWDEAGAYGALALLAALACRSAVGGQFIDLSVHEVAAGREMQVDQFDATGAVLDRNRFVGIPPSGVWECADGPLNVSVHQARHWPAFLEMLERPAELCQPAFDDAMIRRALFDALAEMIEPIMRKHSRNELFARGQAAGLPCAIVYSPAEFLHDEQTIARGFVQQSEWGGRSVALPASALGTASPLVRARGAVPLLGTSNTDLYVDELGFSTEQLAAWKRAGLV